MTKGVEYDKRNLPLHHKPSLSGDQIILNKLAACCTWQAGGMLYSQAGSMLYLASWQHVVLHELAACCTSQAGGMLSSQAGSMLYLASWQHVVLNSPAASGMFRF
jgi:hypothetical protein